MIRERTEIVTAEKLRPHDVLLCTDGHQLPVDRIERYETGAVELHGPHMFMLVRAQTRFRRVCFDRRIDMRPDLHGGVR